MPQSEPLPRKPRGDQDGIVKLSEMFPYVIARIRAAGERTAQREREIVARLADQYRDRCP